ncbi:MAG: RNA polymerase sigma factor [Actinobacteria bacterium]|nr:RNA polymerase sigma factor [Actinomycetota bacterium]
MSIPPFAAFLEEHRGPVYRFLVAAVGRDGADDCFQETFLSALRAYPRLRDASNLRSWVLTIANRKAIDHHRARARAIPVGAAVAEAGGRGAVSGPDGDPEVWWAVRALPPAQRAAVVHRYVLDLPYAEVARILGCSEEAARAAAYEGRRKLRTVLEGTR